MERNYDEMPQILVTGRYWLGVAGARLIGAEVIDMINSAKREIIIVAYRLTISVNEINQALEKALERGCNVRIIRNGADQIVRSEENYLENLLTKYTTLSVWDFKETDAQMFGIALHAKMIIVDRKVAVVGSANFSRNGMIENHEIAVRLSGPEVKSLGMACEELLKNGRSDGVVTQWKKKDV